MAAVRCGTLFGLLVLSIACIKPDRLTAPTSPTQTASTVQPRPTAGEPLTGLAGVYLFDAPISPTQRVRDFTRASKYVLQDSGNFSLQYASLQFEVVGTYRLESGLITFHFDGYESATGTLNGGVLEVQYSARMEHSDFESAVYRRSQ